MTLRSLAIAALAVFAAACSQEATTQVNPSEPAAAIIDASAQPFLGKADAEIVLVEFGAPTCPACGSWHAAFWEQVKAAYIDTDKIRFEFRVLPSHNPPVDAAIAGLALCAGPAKYYDVIDQAFADQIPIEQASRSGQALQSMIDFGKKFDMTEERVRACIADQGRIDHVLRVQGEAAELNVTGTPTFVLNGKLINDPRFPTLSKAIDEALAASGPAPADTAEPDADPS